MSGLHCVLVGVRTSLTVWMKERMSEAEDHCPTWVMVGVRTSLLVWMKERTCKQSETEDLPG